MFAFTHFDNLPLQRLYTAQWSTNLFTNTVTTASFFGIFSKYNLGCQYRCMLNATPGLQIKKGEMMMMVTMTIMVHRKVSVPLESSRTNAISLQGALVC